MLPIVSRTALLLCLAGSSLVIVRPSGSLRAEEAAPPAVIETIEAAVAPVAEIDPSTALELLQPEAPPSPGEVDLNTLPTPAPAAALETVFPTFVAPEAEVVGEVPVWAEPLNAELTSTATPAPLAEEIGYTPADQNPPDQPEPLIVDIPTPEELPVSEIGLPTEVATEPVVAALPEAPVVEIVEESIPAVETPAEVVAEAVPAAPVVVEETLPEVAPLPVIETPAVETPAVEASVVEPVVETLPEAPAVEIVEESIPAVETPAEVVAEAIPADPAAESVLEPVMVVDSLPSTGELVSEEPVVSGPVAEPVFTDISQETDFLPLPTFPVETVDPTPDPRVEGTPAVVTEVVPVDTPVEIPATPTAEVPAETSVFEALRSEDLDTTPVVEGAPQLDAPSEVIPTLPEVSENPVAEGVLPDVLAEAPLGCQPPAEGVLADPEIAPSVDAPSTVLPLPAAGDPQPAIATEIREVLPAEECPSAPELPVDAGDELAPVPVEVHLPLELFDSL